MSGQISRLMAPALCCLATNNWARPYWWRGDVGDLQLNWKSTSQAIIRAGRGCALVSVVRAGGNFFNTQGYSNMVKKLNFKREKIIDIQKALKSADVNQDNKLDFEEWRANLKSWVSTSHTELGPGRTRPHCVLRCCPSVAKRGSIAAPRADTRNVSEDF